MLGWLRAQDLAFGLFFGDYLQTSASRKGATRFDRSFPLKASTPGFRALARNVTVDVLVEIDCSHTPACAIELRKCRNKSCVGLALEA